MPDLIRKRQAAELLGVSAPRISQLLRAGHLNEVAGTGMLSRADVEAFAQSRDPFQAAHSPPRSRRTAAELQQRSAIPPSPGMWGAASKALPSIAESRQHLEALKAAIAQHDLDTRRGKLVSREEVARAAFQEGQRVRQALEGLPYRIAHGLAGALGLDVAQVGFVVQEAMAHEIRQVLLTLAVDPDGPPCTDPVNGDGGSAVKASTMREGAERQSQQLSPEQLC